LKAVILAGGRGSRLMPLTDSVPKPLVIVGDKPVIFHVLDKAKEQGIDEVVITLGYLGNKIEQAVKTFKTDLKITFSYEKVLLGTAGAVKNALKETDEDFFVLSADAYCEFDLKSAYEFHKQKKSAFTMVSTTVEDPREYGLIITDNNDRIIKYIEKPGWQQALTDKVNSGVYIVGRDVFKLIPNDREYDFSKNLLPLLLKKDIPVFSKEDNGYWCDIGDINSLLSCHRHILKKQAKNDSLPRGEFEIEDSVCIKENVKINNNTKIKKYSFIGQGASIGKNCEISSSIIYPSVTIGDNCRIEEAVVCDSAVLENDCRILGPSCVGENGILRNNSFLMQHSSVYPSVEIGENISVSGAVRESVMSSLSDFIPEGFIPNVNALDALEIGLSVGDCMKNKKTAVAIDPSVKSKSVYYALISGLLQGGTQVWDFSEAFYSQMGFFTSFCSLELGIFVSTKNNRTSISICGEGGLPLSRETQRELIKRLKAKNYTLNETDSFKQKVEMSNASSIYSSVLLRQSESSLSGIKAKIETDNERINNLLEECISNLEGEKGEDIIINISTDGTVISVTENNIVYSHGRILALLCYYETARGRDVVLDSFAPSVCMWASGNNEGCVKTLRSFEEANSNSLVNEAKKQLWTRDALFMAVRLLSLMHEESSSLKKLMKDIPDFYISEFVENISFAPSKLYAAFGKAGNADIDEGGIRITKNGSVAHVIPSPNGKRIRILAESFRSETAKSLCEEVSQRVKSFSSGQNIDAT